MEEDIDWNPPFNKLLAAKGPTIGASTMAGEGPRPNTNPPPPLIVAFPRSVLKISQYLDIFFSMDYNG